MVHVHEQRYRLLQELLLPRSELEFIRVLDLEHPQITRRVVSALDFHTPSMSDSEANFDKLEEASCFA